ncbi:hypothetical protein [Halolamina sp. C58]|uniref:hypothetical protein n=1 Tax=Halolamina sp. C58 TaxID=3421640 RepID=UPI003EB6EC52
MVDLLGAAVLTAFFAVALGYVWLTHLIDTRIEAATDEYGDRLDRIEDRLDDLETAVDERED